MGKHVIFEELELLGRTLSGRSLNIELYIFGSFLTKFQRANDIDILVLYETISHLESIKKSLNDLYKYYPLDVTYLTFEEEVEFNFIERQNALIIFKLCK